MLSNVGRHAQASTVTIDITASAQTITIAIQDNGRGADAYVVWSECFKFQAKLVYSPFLY